MSGKKVAVVTGSNKGIGFAIVRGLCKQWDGDVYLTARDEGRGLQAVEDLKKEGLSPHFHQLDISDADSVQRLRQFLQDKYGGLDILVNNAAIAYSMNSTVPFSEQAENSCKVNFTDTLSASKTLFPIMRPHARVVHMSSRAATMSLAKVSPEVKARIMNVSSMDDIKSLIADFVEATKAGNHQEKGFPNSAYGMSKIGLTAATFLQQKMVDIHHPDSDYVINCCCPGMVATDMSGGRGVSIDEGADTPLYLALLPAGTTSPKGNFVAERKIIDWK